MRRAAWLLALVAAGCTELVPTQRGDRPNVTILTPATDAEVPYNTPFHLSAVARAPQGTLSQVHVVLRGEASTEQTVPLSGAEADIELDLIVPQDALLGEDHRPLDLVLIVESVVDGVTVAAAPQGVTLQMLDRTAPTVQLYSPDALPGPPEGIDLSVPAGQSFTLGLSAEDAIGGIVHLGFDAPSVLGGLRALERPASRSARFEAVFSPPVNGDFDIEIFAEDAARVSNRTARKVRVRVGAGGTDATAPALQILAPTQVQCRDVAQLVVTATDTDSGVERLWVELDGQARRIFSRDQDSAPTLSWTGTVAAPGPAGQPLLVRAAAHNFFGRVSAIETATITTIDRRGPEASATLPAVLTPGATATIAISAQEACGTLSDAQLVLTDAAGTSTTVSQPLSGSGFSGDLSFHIPAHLCTTSALQVALHVFDDAQNVTLAAQGALGAEDRVGPTVDIGLLLPGSGVRPGQSAPLQVDLQDLGSGVAGATVTVSLLQTSVTEPVLLHTAAWPAAGCGTGRQQSLSLVAWLPADLRILGPASLQVQVQAVDHLGHSTAQTLEVPIIDDAPPSIRFIGPAADMVLIPGQTSTVSVFVQDINSDVGQVQLQVTGPATLNGQTVQVRALGARTATLGFALQTDALAPPGATVQLQAMATDTATPAVSATADLGLRTCGAPTLSSVQPPLGPVAGGTTLSLIGQGLAPGLSVSAGPIPLQLVRVLSSTLAEARVPLGPHSPGSVTLAASNRCGATIVAEAVASLTYDFIPAPSLTLMRPRNDGGTTPGARLFVGAGAQSAVALSELGAQIDGQAAVVQPTNALRANLDGVLLVAATATSAVELTVWALDSLGQRSEVIRQVPLTGDEPVRLALHTPHEEVGVAERVAMGVFALGRDQRWRDVTLTASISVDRPDRLQHLGGPRYLALRAGTATVSARLDGLQTQRAFQVLQDALLLQPQSLHMSHLVVAGSTQAAAAPLQATLLTGGQRVDVTADVAWSVVPASLAQVQGSMLTALSPGLAQLRAQGFGQVATRAVRIDPRLDVGVEQRVFVPGGQRFSGGQIDGTVSGFASGPWTIEVDPGGLLRVGSTGILRLEGGGGAWSSPGVGGPGAEAGASPGAPTQSISSGQPGLSSGSGGGGGGSDGAGGMGGALMSGTSGLAGQSHPALVGGGGAGPRTAGGGGGAVAVLNLAQASLQLDGLISAAGGTGATGTSTVAGAGGGAGGRVRIHVATLEGSGRVLVCGGAGGAGMAAGGGAGAGRVELWSSSPPSPTIDVGWAGGAAGPSAGATVMAEDGNPGSVRR